jgi:hypothetical protein
MHLAERCDIKYFVSRLSNIKTSFTSSELLHTFPIFDGSIVNDMTKEVVFFAACSGLSP